MFQYTYYSINQSYSIGSKLVVDNSEIHCCRIYAATLDTPATHKFFSISNELFGKVESNCMGYTPRNKGVTTLAVSTISDSDIAISSLPAPHIPFTQLYLFTYPVVMFYGCCDLSD